MWKSLQVYRHNEWCPVKKIGQLQLPQANPLVTDSIGITLEIKQGKTLAEANQIRVCQILLAIDQAERHRLFSDRYSVLVAQYSRKCSCCAAQLPLLEDKVLMSYFQERADWSCWISGL